jgi:hypothetical protein
MMNIHFSPSAALVSVALLHQRDRDGRGRAQAAHRMHVQVPILVRRVVVYSCLLFLFFSFFLFFFVVLPILFCCCLFVEIYQFTSLVYRFSFSSFLCNDYGIGDHAPSGTYIRRCII